MMMSENALCFFVMIKNSAQNLHFFRKSLLNLTQFFAIFLNTLFCYILTLLSSNKNHLIILTQLIFSDNASQDFYIFFLYGGVVSHRVYSIKPLKRLVFGAKFKA